MKIIQNYLTNNNCYLKGQTIKINGIMVHSTACPGVKASNFLKSWNTAKPNGNSVCVHAFVDDTGIYQTLPWNYQGWHAGGNANNSYIGFEICEPKDYSDKEYFLKVKSEAVKLCVYLCQKFNLAPESILTHCEGYKLKGKTFASNHADIYHWWKKYHNYTMGDFRNEVKKALESEEKKMKFNTGTEALNYLTEKGRITNKEYWQKVLDTTRNTEYLFIKWAQDVYLLEK